jgi:hypothetical protein
MMMMIMMTITMTMMIVNKEMDCVLQFYRIYFLLLMLDAHTKEIGT